MRAHFRAGKLPDDVVKMPFAEVREDFNHPDRLIL
jgi:hypothetical protein